MPDLDMERITLNVIPEGELPVFHASQFETARPFFADLMWGTSEFTLGEGNWCTLSIRKVDDTLVIIDSIDVDGNEVSCLLPQQAVACSGENICQLKVWTNDGENDICVACLNFVLQVQRDPEAGGITSESEIQNLTEQIEEITQQVIGDDYYTKVQTDALLADKADKSDTYTKTQTDNLLNDKADKSTTYTKSQVDSALALKADKSDTYTKTQVDNALNLKADKSTTYTKSETDTLLSTKANTADLATVATTGDYDDLINKPTFSAEAITYDDSASGLGADNVQDAIDEVVSGIIDMLPVGEVSSAAIASFETALGFPLVDCNCTIDPTLTGATGLTLNVCGVNVFNMDGWLTSLGVAYTKTNDTWSLSTSSATYNNPFIVSTVDRPITLSVKSITGTATNVRLQILNSSNTVVESCYANETKTATGCKVRINYSNSGTADIEKPQIVLGSTPVEYTPYNGTTYPVTWQDEAGTVYGGEIDLTMGVLTVNYGRVDLGSLNWSYDSNYPAFYTTNNTNPLLMTKGNIITSMYTTNIVGVALMSDMQISTWNNYGQNKIIIKNSNYTDAPTFKTAMSGVYATYELATTQTYQLDPVSVRALVGVNNVFSDVGNTSVKYKDSIQHYIDERI